MDLVVYYHNNFLLSYILDPFVIRLDSSPLPEYLDDYQPVVIVGPESLNQFLKRKNYSTLDYTEIFHTQTQ